jgi:hypothetical protein
MTLRRLTSPTSRALPTIAGKVIVIASLSPSAQLDQPADGPCQLETGKLRASLPRRHTLSQIARADKSHRMKPKHPFGPPMDLVNMRRLGCIASLVVK